MYIYTSVWRENTIMIHVHINWCWCYSFLVFSSKCLLIFYHVSAFFIVPWYLQKFLITAGLKEKKNPKIKHYFIGIWWFTQVGTYDADHFRQIQMMVMFLSASPGTISHLCGLQRTPEFLLRPKADIKTFSVFYGRKIMMIVLDLWPHIF